MSLTTDPNDPRLKRNSGDDEPGQNEVYLVLSEEDRAKGFVRPVRHTYIHKGRKYDKPIEVLEEAYVSEGKTYVAIVTVLENEDGSRKGGKYLTQDELDEHKKTGGYIGGCGSSTKMGQALSETYATNPSFYGATYCVGCCKHIGVGEFVWEDGEIVGS